TLVINSNKTKLISKGTSTFDGNVVVAKNNQKLTADHVTVMQNSAGQVESFTAVGKVKLTEPGMRLLGNRGKLFLKDNRKIMYKANYRIYDHHATGNAEHLEVLQDQIINMPNATYSTCAPNDQIWKLSAKQVKLNKHTGRGEAWHAKMYIKDTPIFYWPYVNFPLDKRRQTGFLLPIISSNSNDGFTLGIPWYWNIAPNYDYTFSPIYMSKRGIKFNNQFRYLTNKSLGVIRCNVLFKDREYKNYIKQKINNRGSIPANDLRYIKLFNSKNDFRYGVAYHNISDLDSLGKVYINYNRVSDDHYLRDFGKDLGQVGINSLFKVTKNHNKIHNFYGAGAYLEELLHSTSLHLEQ
ncbi:MAG: LPS-assembly protein LptD, partial [Gammaproteobacteria bacterium]